VTALAARLAFLIALLLVTGALAFFAWTERDKG